jgi:hypothetical protein
MTGRTAIAAGATAVALVAVIYTGLRGGGGDGLSTDVGLVPLRDVVIARDGEVHEGRLARCVAASCRLGEREYERDRIAFIGLAVAAATPPPVEDPTRDEIHLRAGGVLHQPLAQIDPDVVLAGARRIDRMQVAWIALAPEPEEPAPQAAEEAPRAREPPEPIGEPPPPETETPPPREANRDPVQPCPADRPLGGAIEYSYAYKDREFHRCSGTAQLWFRLHTLPNQWPYELRTVWQSDAITYRLLNDGCTPEPNDRGLVCVAPAQPEVCGNVVLGEVGQFGVNLIGAPGGPVIFNPLDPGLRFLTLPDEIAHRVETPVRCFEPSGGGTGSWTLPVIGEVTTFGRGDCGSELACVAPTLCVRAEGDQQRDCMTHPDRYAVIPFAGDQSVVYDTGGIELLRIVKTQRFRWNVCCGCGEAPACAPRPPDCANEAEQLERLVGRMRALAEAYRYHERDLRCAEQRRDAWRDRVWGFGGTLSQFAATLPMVVPHHPRYQKLAMIVPALSRLFRGDGSALEHIEAAIHVAANDDAMMIAQNQAFRMLRAAFRAWNEHIARGRGLREAARAFRDQVRHMKSAFRDVKQAAKSLQVVSGLIDMAEAASALADDIMGYAEWRQEAEQNQQAMQDAQDQMADVQRQIDALRWRCPNLPPPPSEPPATVPEAPCPERPDQTGEGEPTASAPPAPGIPQRDFVLASTGGASSEDDFAALRERFAALAAIEERVVARTADEILPLLSPFLFRQTEAASPELLAELLREAQPHLEALLADLEKASSLGSEIESTARRLAPDSDPTIPKIQGAWGPGGVGPLAATPGNR